MTTQRVALITGANKGIGKAVAKGLATDGFTVLLGSRNLARGRAAAAELASFGDIRPIRLEITSQADVDAAARLVSDEFGHLDVLVNNAGVNVQGHRDLDYLPKPSEETVDDLRFVYEVNVFGIVTMMNAFLPMLRAAPAARVVNVTSKRGSIGEEGAWVGQPSLSYSSSKTAVNALTVHYAREFAQSKTGSKIKINGAAPGHVATDFNGYRGTLTPDEGAAVVIRLATLGEDGPSGTVYEGDTQLAW